MILKGNKADGVTHINGTHIENLERDQIGRLLAILVLMNDLNDKIIASKNKQVNVLMFAVIFQFILLFLTVDFF